ncbi:hypothetical protein KAFR_0A06770 [Kazachstania africana CBS 2517]|uniref:Homeobox domain-containing protein n=1 Tax=Kazachstania africana (strain ATCC 22294 / BCRC 22015 / CBS 2517 / CECT 1963 / NBRC 1671 / NRRL Y-8276) TaxID=1071382 RepID=H2AP12_KAZAF|nr:hypothetical protein KAFR_0A06770 [Kazachstania africana CBS 2517]CCF56112.1 hypothetical protein KAFR_0A06770 [Kazachstania africana CBS 2517]
MDEYRINEKDDKSQQRSPFRGGKRNRATGEKLDFLKQQFKSNPSPSVQQRREIAKLIDLPEKTVTIWFQNRRAKLKKRLRESDSVISSQSDNDSDSDGSSTENVDWAFDKIPLDLNNDYYLIDCSSLAVGSWSRNKVGTIPDQNTHLIRSLRNLSPFSVSNIMKGSTDLLVLISKKNFEINYFFTTYSATNNQQMLFRIFFPIDSIVSCSLTLENIDNIVNDADGDDDSLANLQLTLQKPPTFAVFFVDENASNQWYLCDDFSESKQVSNATLLNGSRVPQVLNGLQSSLKFMNSFILDQKSLNSSLANIADNFIEPTNNENLQYLNDPSFASVILQNNETNFELNSLLEHVTHNQNDALFTDTWLADNNNTNPILDFNDIPDFFKNPDHI